MDVAVFTEQFDAGPEPALGREVYAASMRFRTAGSESCIEEEFSWS